MPPRPSRRTFIRAAAGAALAAPVPLRHAAFGAGSANEKLVLALLGAGGRGSNLIHGFLERGDIEVAYICDLDARRGHDLLAHCEARQGKAPRRVPDVRRALDDKAVDAVVVATPDHWHALATVLCCQAGKHVYVEKPPSQNVWEGRKMVEAARKYERVVQVGTQNRSAPYNHQARELIASGKLGKVNLVKVFNLKSGAPYRAPGDEPCPKEVDYDLWLGPAPARPFNPGHFHGGWHAWWAYSGGDLADDGIHQLDLARFLVGKDWPESVTASGGKLAFPESDAEVPDTQVATIDFGDLLMTMEHTSWAQYMDKIAGDIRMGGGFPYWPQCATRVEIYGTDAVMFLGRHGGGWQVFGKAKRVSRIGELIAEQRGRFPDPEHKEDFVAAIRGGKRPSADIEEGHRSAVLIHLINIATRLGGRRLVFDPETETVAGDREANALIQREYRAPYTIPEIV